MPEEPVGAAPLDSAGPRFMIDQQTPDPGQWTWMVMLTADFGDPLELPHAGDPWWVLHTRSRREKQLALACRKLGVRHYLPLREGRPAWRRGPRSLVPLFPGYVFVCPTPGAYEELVRTGAVVRRIAVRQPEVLVKELREIRAALAAGANLLPTTVLARGRQVQVIEGALRGVTGVVADCRLRQGRVHLVLSVSMLGQGVMVEIDAVDVEPLGGWRDVGIGGGWGGRGSVDGLGDMAPGATT